MNEEQANGARMEWRKFGILAGILFVVVLGVMLARPLIFGRIVPAILGDGKSAQQPEPIPIVVPTETETPMAEPTAVSPEAAPTLEPTAESTQPAQLTHTVQAGETVLAIARQYQVSYTDLISLNNLINPNLIQPGDTLLIPAP